MQFIWQSRFIGNGPYHTSDGKLLEVYAPGLHNFNQGPDFINARIKVDDTEWAGNIELHINASDWYKHKHEQDPNFRNIILHIVWVNDQVIFDHLGKSIPCFWIQPYVSSILLDRYSNLMLGNAFIKPCHHYLPAMNHLQWLSWKERLVIERLEKRTHKILQYYQLAKHDWETVSWWLLAANMGLKVNESLFESVAQSIPVRILAKHKNQIHQLEAMFLGQANLLIGAFEEQYPTMLQREYKHLQKKYQFRKLTIQPAYLRMRPASFPTIRLAQLASIIQNIDHLFDLFKNSNHLSSVKEKLIVCPNDYWLYHYQLDHLCSYHEKNMGQSMVNSILINTVIPLLYGYGSIMKESSYQEKSMNWLMQIKAEQNRFTKEWVSYQIANQSAFDSQALIELSKGYCKEKRCLECAVGVAILGCK